MTTEPSPRPVDSPAAAAVPSDGGDRVRLGGVPFQFMVEQQWVRGAYTLAKQQVAPRQLIAPHVHDHHDQVAFVTRGAVMFRVGDDEYVVEEGGLSFRGRGVPHALWNPSDTEAEILEITSPGDLELYFRQVGAMSEAGSASRTAVQEVAAAYGLRFEDDWTADLSHRYGVSVDGGFWST